MVITIKSIDIENFKGVQYLSLAFNDANIIKISAKNGVGKSTLCDAIFWCLFGKDANGNAQFGLKTRDLTGCEIPHLEHSVTLHLIIDSKEKVIRRGMKEKWSKPRGCEDEILTGNFLEYYLDGEKVTKSDYDAYISSLVSLKLFSILSSPHAFSLLNWQEKRNILANIAGEITDEDITGGDARYKILLAELKGQSLESYRKHLNYQIRELRKTIDVMPTKLETLKYTLPEEEDWAHLKEIYKENEKKIGELKSQLRLANSGVPASKAYLLDKISFANRRIENIRISKRNLVRQEQDEYDSALRSAKTLLSEAETTKVQLLCKRKGIELVIDRCNEHLDELKTAKAMLEADWKLESEKKFSFNETSTVCPTCGQELPAEKVREAYEKALESFQKTKAERKVQMRAKAEKVKLDEAQTIQQKEESIILLKENQEQITTSTSVLKDYENKVNGLTKEVPPTIDDLLGEDENYQKILLELTDLRAQLNGDPQQEKPEELKALENEVKNIEQAQGLIEKSLSNETQYNRILKMIEDTKAKWKELNGQLTALEKKDDAVESYLRKRDDILETRVNAYFNFVKFKLFRTLVDGTREPYCVATVDGVEIKDVNSAGKINAGLDIINTLSKHFNTRVPIYIDGAESYQNILQTESQQLQMYVGPESTLTII